MRHYCGDDQACIFEADGGVCLQKSPCDFKRQTRLQYGVERNGEHGKIFDSRKQAGAHIAAAKSSDANSRWVENPTEAQYRIVELTPRRLAQGW